MVIIEKGGINLTTKTFKISGMHCAACAVGSEKSIKRLPGIISASVNLATETAVVEYDPALVKFAEIKGAVTMLGYTVVELEDKKAVAEETLRKQAEARAIRRRVIISVILSVSLLYISMGHMIWSDLPLPSFISMHGNPLGYALVQLALTAVILYCGRRFYTVGFKSLIKRIPNMDTLVAIGTGSAFLYSVYNTVLIALGDHMAVERLFYESAAIVVTLVMLGKYLEAFSKGKTSAAIEKLTELAPDKATIEKNGKQLEISTSELAVGDIVVVFPGGRFPCDGTVVEGISSADNSMLTGESLPVPISEGSSVIGGAINGEGLIKFRAEKVGSDTALSQIVRMVEDAQGKKAPIAHLADVISGYFVPAVLAIATVSALIWALLGKDASFVLNIFVSVLIIACPCALGLATPTAIMVGTGRGAEFGILFKSGEALQAAHNLTHIVLDKTGTVTEGKPVLTDIALAGSMEENELLAIAAAAESGSEHPVARAIIRAASDRSLELPQSSDISAIPGRGIEAKVSGKSVLIGNLALMQERGVDVSGLAAAAEKFSSSGKILMYCAIDGSAAGLFAAADTIKEGSAEAIRNMHKLGLKTIMLTGDNSNAAKSIASSVGIDEVIAEILPGDKANEVEKLTSSGMKVAMVGDGINDAPALAAATVGIAIGTGTDVAIESADIVLMSGDLNGVYGAIKLSKAVMRNIKENLFWAFIYNCIGIPFAAGLIYAFGGPLLTPMFGGAAMALSSVCVVGNALRLRGFKIK